MLILERPWTRQPQYAAKINDKLTSVVDVWLGSVPNITLIRKEPTVISNAFTTTSSMGRGAGFNGADNSYIRIAEDQNTLFTNKDRATIAIYRKPRDTTARNATLLGGANGASSVDRMLLQFPYSTSYYFDWGNNSTGRISVSKSKVVAHEAIVAIAGKNGMLEIWSNGIKIASGASSQQLSSSVFAIYIGDAYATTSSDAEDVSLVVVASEPWSDKQVIDWSHNPWGETFAPQQIYIPTAAAASSLPTLSASTYVPGSVTATGWRPRVTAQF